MNKIVLDASALLALVNQEKGTDIVAEIIENTIMSNVNICEVISELNSKIGMPLQDC